MMHKIAMRINYCLLSLLLLLCPPLKADNADDINIPALSLPQQRHIYQEAKTAFSRQKTQEYQQLKGQLHNYPLLPYLDFMEIAAALKHRPYQQIDHFLEQHPKTYLEKRLLSRWLRQLATEGRWHEFREYYSSSSAPDSAAFQCLFLWSRIKTGDKTALDEVAHLWNVGYSQPDDCDHLFAYWRRQGYLSDALQWRRFTKVVQKNNLGLAQYLKRFMSTEMRSFASLLLKVHKNPQQIRQVDQFHTQQALMADILYHGLQRFSRTQADEAQILLARYQDLYIFSPSQLNHIHYRLAIEFAQQQQAALLTPLLDKLTAPQQIYVIEKILLQWLKTQNWQQINQWIGYLPEAEQQNYRWQYWQTRAQEALSIVDKNRIEAAYYHLARKRDYYGFLAADRLQQAYNFEHQPLLVADSTREHIAQLPAIKRAKELFLMGNLHQARQEWKHAIAEFNEQETKAVASLAFEWGWYRKSIEAMTAVKAWDDLNMRFPITYQEHIFQQATEHGIAPTLILSIARQESAWQIDAHSRAGAMGLMQLMPQTAKETARKARIKHNRKRLFQPQHNIELGSHHIKELITHYNQNRLPAIAAYNAGRAKVNRWLADTKQQLPFDVWIEVIPYKETRHYVKNILSYSLVYGYRLGQTPNFITQAEANSLL
ncbi:MAG: transglycosylase SLT domain-containing protein [Cellvibrionaceae bacterium]|nr:transglycosylase SLT domain-containing protein [Cellvibrionaceae bacterium]